MCERESVPLSMPQSRLTLFRSFSGGAEPREAQLGAPERRPARSHHSGGHAGAGRDQDEESRGGGEEAPGAGGQYSLLSYRPQLKCMQLVVCVCPSSVAETRSIPHDRTQGK